MLNKWSLEEMENCPDIIRVDKLSGRLSPEQVKLFNEGLAPKAKVKTSHEFELQLPKLDTFRAPSPSEKISEEPKDNVTSITQNLSDTSATHTPEIYLNQFQSL